MNHQLINTGAGWRCLRCKVAWDQGEDTSGDCAAGDEYRFDASDMAAKSLDIDPSFVDAEDRFPDLAVKREPTFNHQFTISPPPPPPVDATPTSKSSVPVARSPTPPKPDAMSAQVGGQHYKTLAIQPTEFCQRNGLDFCIGSILKYLTRYRSKNGVEDLRKARHFVEIRESFPLDIQPPRRIVITMLEYVTRNGIRPDDAEALYRLEAYYNSNGATGTYYHHASGATRVIHEIDKLIDLYA